HNAFGELISLRTDAAEGALLSQGLSQVLSQVLSRDRLGRITALTETVAGETRELSFEYDSVGRLIEATDEGVVTRYEYHTNANRTKLTSDGREVRAEYDAQDRLQSHGGLQFEQTAEGDLIRKSDGARALELAYDELGSLLSAMVSNGLVTTEIAYVVDGAGRRIGKQVNGELQRSWLYLDALRPVAELDSAGHLTHFVYAGNGAPDVMLRGSESFRLVKDHLGSVRLVVDTDTGEVLQELRYGPFGEVLVDTNPGFQPFGFAGGLYDPDTGLVRFGARDYDPEVGRWTSKDPIGLSGGVN